MATDLNLLRVFDTLMELRSVTHAADRLGLTQSAISHALGRLRRTLDDPLFTRSAQGLRPTARATEIASGVREGLRRLEQTLVPATFDAHTAGRRFTLAASSYFSTLLIPSLVARARIEAPMVSFRIVQIEDQLVAAIDRGSVDLAFGVYLRAPGRFVIEPLFEDEMVWICAHDAPTASRPFDAEWITTQPRVEINARLPLDGAPSSSGEDGLISSTISTVMLDEVTTVYDSQAAILLVASSDMVAMVPRRIAGRAADTVRILGRSGAQTIQTTMVWHARQRSDPVFDWLRRLILTLV